MSDGEKLALLRTVLWRRAPRLVSLMAAFPDIRLSDEEREIIRSVLVDELLERGLESSEEPSTYGRKLDDLIGWLAQF